MPGKWLFFFNELRGKDIEVVGKKCANLGEMTNAGMPVPPGFALSLDVYQRFMKESGANEEIRQYLRKFGEEGPLSYSQYNEASKVIREIVESKPMPQDIAEVIKNNYWKLCEQCGNQELPVATRSSGTVSMPGAYETYLNIRGAEDVVKHVIKVWGSVFSVQALGGRMVKKQPVEIPGIGVAVLKMVNARAAGVAFTKHPNTGDPNKVVIEATWGLGESVVSGNMSPDRYIINKKTREITKKINTKTKQVVYKDKGTAYVDVPTEIQNVQCLTDDEINRVVELSLKVEKYYGGVAQDMEWVIENSLPESDNLFLVQTRNITKTGEYKSSSEMLADMMVKRLFSL
ncbi:MAG: PEP/pyruvate-binding domain-containing protein [Thermincola sp.]|nr:PEP/pyruvate-binding domain-containing protein [Thermincola sp.]MDT3705003.1 PEP/pyruvate-binding domain-containing protein [Thermincola sp.]